MPFYSPIPFLVAYLIFPACWTPPQSDPSAIPLSPQNTQTLNGSLSRYLPARAMPTPTASPCPNDPVATSTHGRTGVGWPSRRLPNLRRVSSSASVIAPAALNSAYSRGDACPFENTRGSLPGRFGFAQSQ